MKYFFNQVFLKNSEVYMLMIIRNEQTFLTKRIVNIEVENEIKKSFEPSLHLRIDNYYSMMNKNLQSMFSGLFEKYNVKILKCHSENMLNFGEHLYVKEKMHDRALLDFIYEFNEIMNSIEVMKKLSG